MKMVKPGDIVYCSEDWELAEVSVEAETLVWPKLVVIEDNDGGLFVVPLIGSSISTIEHPGMIFDYAFELAVEPYRDNVHFLSVVEAIEEAVRFRLKQVENLRDDVKRIEELERLHRDAP